MTILYRSLAFSTLLLFLACANGAEEQSAPPTSTTPVAATATAPAAPPAPIPPAVQVPTVERPDRDAVITEDKPVINNRPAPEPTAPPAAPATPKTTTATAPPPPPPPVTVPEPTAETNEETPEVVEGPVEIVVNTPDHKDWDQLLQQYVDNKGGVDYAGLKQNEAKLDKYLMTLAKATPSDLWSREEGLAYWINAYNAFTFKLILNNYPVTSITNLDGGDPWKVKWIKLGGKTYSLNNIEHDIIRPRYKDPRIHFAVVCAAKSCPPLLNRSFRPAILNRQLHEVTKQFINNKAYNDTDGDVRVSKIFEWYQEDFGDLNTYLNKYLTTPITNDQAIGFMDYDWSLNKQ